MLSVAFGMNAEDQDNIDADVDLMCSLGRRQRKRPSACSWAAIWRTTEHRAKQDPYKRDKCPGDRTSSQEALTQARDKIAKFLRSIRVVSRAYLSDRSASVRRARQPVIS